MFAPRHRLAAATSLTAVAGVAVSTLIVASSAVAAGASCPADSGGITVAPGFCASVFADHLGHARDMAVAPDGTVYLNTWSGVYYHNDTPPPGGFLLSLKDTKGSGRADSVVRFGPTAQDGSHGGTGIALYDGYVYAEMNDRILRFRLPPDGAVPTEAPQTVVSGMPLTGDHPMHPFAIDARGTLYVDSGSATNSCQPENRMPEIPGNQPCTELEIRAGTWRFDAAVLDQPFTPAARFTTGLRNGEGIAFDANGRILATQHGRDELFENWPKLYTSDQGANLPAEELVRLTQGADFGWPECYFDGLQKQLMLAPEYGGDGHKVGVCATKTPPIAFFPAHWAPNSLLIADDKLPEPYRGGAFIAFHGSWNRAPHPQGGYNIVFQPLQDGKANGAFTVFADGFAGGFLDPSAAKARPSGLAEGPDGAIYVSDDQGGNIWRIVPAANATITSVQSAPAPAATATNAPLVEPPEGIHPGAGGGTPLPVPPGATAAQVARGDSVFHGEDGGTCSGCHGAGGQGSPVGAKLTGPTWLWSNGDLAGIRATIVSGVAKPKAASGAMPPLGGVALSNEDVDALAAYVWAIGHR
jgi:glucose/arabinose dehydrogenase/cytochrome c5